MADDNHKHIGRRNALGLLGAAGAGVGLAQMSQAAPAAATTLSTTLQDLIDGAPTGGSIELDPAGSYSISDTLIIDKPLTLFSAGVATITMSGEDPAISVTSSNVKFAGLSIICAGSGIVVATSGNLSSISADTVTVRGPGPETAGCVGLDLQSVSDSYFENVTISYFERCVRLSTDNSSGSAAKNNTFMHVNSSHAASCYSILAYHCRNNRFVASRAGATTLGFEIVDAHHTVIDSCALEVCGIGVSIDATSSGTTYFNVCTNSRFEGNTSDWEIQSAYVASSSIINPAAEGGYSYVDGGSQTFLGLEGGPAVSASTVGSVSMKIPVYDPQGYAVGYLPLFSSIS